MKDIIKAVEKEYLDNPLCGVQFSIKLDAYDCDIDDSRIEFGNPTNEMRCGNMYNWQDIKIDDQLVGYLFERRRGRLFDPICVSFCMCLPDNVDLKFIENPHYDETGGIKSLKFATMQQFVNYLRTVKDARKRQIDTLNNILSKCLDKSKTFDKNKINILFVNEDNDFSYGSVTELRMPIQEHSGIEVTTTTRYGDSETLEIGYVDLILGELENILKAAWI